MSKEKNKEYPLIEDDSGVKGKREKSLILYNDDYHTFDYVIQALIDVCKHNTEQAEQCTFLVHYKGKCDVKKGSVNVLKPMKEELAGRDLKATIE
jgi:ATP-dependent Clp protease adaptor protein ClpS